MSLQFAYNSTEALLSETPLHEPEGVTRWFALSVAPRHEKTVSSLLNHKGFETFLPLYARKHKYEGRIRSFELPLFPGYVLCRSNPGTRLPILTTPGVLRLIGAGRVPIPVDDGEILSLKRAVEAGVAMSPHPFWRAGQIGRITNGPLAGIEGTVISVKQSLRLVLSVTLLQRSVALEIDFSDVALV